MKLRVTGAIAALLSTHCACETPRREGPPVTSAAPSAAAPSAPTAADDLDRLDSRSPLPLLPMMANHQKQNMRDHLVVMQEIVAALVIADYPAVEHAAARIGFSEQMGQMCTHMGAGAAGFTEQALAFHHTADGIVEAARARNGTGVLTALSMTLQACTSCHAEWKQQIVDDATWRKAMAPSPRLHE